MTALKQRAFGGDTYETHIGFSALSYKEDVGMVDLCEHSDDSVGYFRNCPAPHCRNRNHHTRWMAAGFQRRRASRVWLANPGNRRANLGVARGHSVPRGGSLS